MNQDQYNDWLQGIVEGNEEWIRAEGIHTVATQCIVSTMYSGGKSLLCFGADPWTRNRAWPSDIIKNRHAEYPFHYDVDGLRGYAVEMLKADIEARLEANE